MTPDAEVIAAIKRGWVLMPLSGKRPILKDWQSLAVPDEATAIAWARAGNLGLCAGQSGLVILDCDPRHGGQPHDLDIPHTVTVETGGGGWHFYFEMPTTPIGNRANVVTGWDVRGMGGQVVYPGSVHPETGREYRWLISPEQAPIAMLTPALLRLIAPAKPARREVFGGSAPTDQRAGKYAQTALERECRAVAATADGGRNDRLNVAAYSLAQLVASGSLDSDTVFASLLSAASASGLSEPEARATITSGMRAGAQAPRSAPLRTAQRRQQPGIEVTAVATTSPEWRDDRLPAVLIPGSHLTDDGEYHEIGAQHWADAAIAALPHGAIYRRANIVGRVVGPCGAQRFEPLTHDAARLLIDAHTRPSRWKRAVSSGNQVRAYVSCTRDLAGLVLAAAATDARIPEITLLTSYPVATAHGISPAGYAHGIYYDEPIELAGLRPDPADALAILDDLVCDFPFAATADRHNFYGLLLTPILRPLTRNAPLHLVMASLPRTGKTKLVDEVLGGIILGRSTPAMQLSGSDEERDKRILAALLRGDTIRHLDNLRDYLDSAALASLLTAPIYSGRILAQSQLIDLPNNLTLVGTGNNVRATKEIVERSMPILLQPSTANPAGRSDFRHPELPAYVASQRRRVMAALLGMIEQWRVGGSTPGTYRMGGFEDWARIVGGVMTHAGADQWSRNAGPWRRAADPASADMAEFVRIWAREHRGASKQARELAQIAREAGLFGACWARGSEQGQIVSFAARVLAAHRDAPLGDGIYLRRSGDSSHALWRLDGIADRAVSGEF